MKDIIKIAWRNLWRNKRRTIITISSIFFAAIIALFMRSLQLGYYNYTFNSLIEHFFGHIQIQQRDYFRNPSIDNVLYFSPKIKKILDQNPEVKFYIPRLQSGAMAFKGTVSHISIINGIDVEKEKKFSGINKKIARFHIDSTTAQKMSFLPPKLHKEVKNLYGYYASKEKLTEAFTYISKDFEKYIDKICQISEIKGHYLKPQDKDILIAGGLADYLGVTVGDSLILLGQGYHGTTAIGKFRIAGILVLSGNAMNNTMIYMALPQAQKMFSTFDILPQGDTAYYVSYIAVNTPYQASIRPADYKPIEKVVQKLTQQLNDPEVRVMGWQEINKTLYQQLQSDNVSGMVIIFVIYIIIALGVFGTVLMMTAERRKEFGIMLAIGMSRKKLKQMIAWEIFFMTMIGLTLAIIVTYPTVVYLHYNPIYLGHQIAEVYSQFNFEPYMPTELPGTQFIIQSLVIIFIMMLTSIYPLIHLSKLKISKALRA